MAIFLLVILVVSLLIIATESVNHINKAAIAMFGGVCCWLLYIVQGTIFISNEHPIEFLTYISSNEISANSVKSFISEHIFVKYIAQCANIVLFLLATTCIVEVLSSNGCFDFIAEWMRTRNPKKLLWTLASITFIISANLDNLATVVLLLSIIHPLLQDRKVRRVYCSVIILAANLGGVIAVISDMTCLKLWSDGLIQPTAYFSTLILPALTALSIILYLFYRNLPRRIEFATTTLPYRGDDTILNRSQRLLMLFVGIGGLWFIPTFHRITLLPPFVGALCVLALLWIVNELCNRQLLRSDKMTQRRLPLALQYANIQNILYYIGLILMFGALTESGILKDIYNYLITHIDNIYIISLITTFISSILGNVPTLLGSSALFNQPSLVNTPECMQAGGVFWSLLSYTTAWGGSLLSTGTIAGILLMRMEGVSFKWYFKNVTPKVLIGFSFGFILLAITTYNFA